MTVKTALLIYFIPLVLCVITGKLTKDYQTKDMLGSVALIPVANVVAAIMGISTMIYKFVYEYITE